MKVTEQQKKDIKLHFAQNRNVCANSLNDFVTEEKDGYLLANLPAWITKFFKADDGMSRFKQKALFDAERILFQDYIINDQIWKIERLVEAFVSTEIDGIKELELKPFVLGIKAQAERVAANAEYKECLSGIFHQHFGEVDPRSIKDSDYQEVCNLLGVNGDHDDAEL